MSDIPKLIHRYEIHDRLGRGGMGELYLGRDPLLDRYVAIKVLRAGLDAEDLRERFAREAKSAARLAHVNIVTIYDVGEHAGQPYIAMEYVRGETLFQIIQRKTDLPLGTKLQYIDELCAGLAHAHKAGIIHRDIKPANLIVSSEQGALKILDFGIARLADSSMTQAGMVMGTLNYMSPEQITGQPLDHRSDIFAVGAVFYELIAYQQAFPGGIDTGVLSRIMEGKFTPLERVASRIDGALAKVIDKALAKNPNDRYPDLGTMREELARVRQRMDPRLLDASAGIDATSETVSIDTPLATPRTPKGGGTNRSEIRRRREEELASYLTAARDAFAAGQYEEASAACERVLIIDPDHEEAQNLSERARAAIEQHQVTEWITEARAEFDRGNLTRARDLVSFVLSLDATSRDARTLRSKIEQAQKRREVEEAVSRGRMALINGDVEVASAAVQEALAVSPTDDGAAALQRDIDVYVAEQRARVENDRRAREVIPEAKRRFYKGEMAEAIALLQAFTPADHPEVAAALQELRTEARVIREREVERERQVAAELQQARNALANDDLIAAAAAVARARGVSPAHQDVTAVGRAIDARRAELAAKKKADEEAQQQAAVEALRRAEEERRRKADESARQKLALEAKRKADEEAKRAAAEQARRQAEEDKRRKAADEQRRKEEEQRRKEEEQRRKDEEKRLKAEEDARRAEQERQRKADDSRRRQAAAVAPAPEPAPSPFETMAIPPLKPTPAPAPAPIKQGTTTPPLGIIAAAAVLAIALLGGLVYYFTAGDDEQPEQQTGAQPATGTQPTPPTGTQTPAPVPTGTLVIDAAPWAEIVEVVGATGRMAPSANYTPVALTLPEGEYKITLRNPNDATPRVVTVKVTAATPARAFAEFKPVDVDDYFRRAGS